MYTELSTKLAVAASGTEYSQAVSMQGGNAIAVELTVFSGTGVTVEYEVGNDLQNWDDATAFPSSALASKGVGAYLGATTATIAGRYVRLKYSATTAAIVAAGINVANL